MKENIMNCETTTRGVTYLLYRGIIMGIPEREERKVEKKYLKAENFQKLLRNLKAQTQEIREHRPK